MVASGALEGHWPEATHAILLAVLAAALRSAVHGNPTGRPQARCAQIVRQGTAAGIYELVGILRGTRSGEAMTRSSAINASAWVLAFLALGSWLAIAAYAVVLWADGQ